MWVKLTFALMHAIGVDDIGQFMTCLLFKHQNKEEKQNWDQVPLAGM